MKIDECCVCSSIPYLFCHVLWEKPIWGYYNHCSIRRHVLFPLGKLAVMVLLLALQHTQSNRIQSISFMLPIQICVTMLLFFFLQFFPQVLFMLCFHQTVNERLLESLNKLSHLGSTVTSTFSLDEEIRT